MAMKPTSPDRYATIITIYVMRLNEGYHHWARDVHGLWSGCRRKSIPSSGRPMMLAMACAVIGGKTEPEKQI